MNPNLQNENEFYNILPYDRETFLLVNRIKLADIKNKLRARPVKNDKEKKVKKPSEGAISLALRNSSEVSKEFIQRVCKAVFKVYLEKQLENSKNVAA
jgi:hypothetical protein